MILSELLYDINTAFRGSDDDAPTSGASDYTMWLSVINRKKNEWARDGKNKWSSLFETRDVGTVAASTQSYDLDDEIIGPADSVIVTTTDDQEIEYKIVKPAERNRFAKSCYVSGRDPQVLTFSDTIESTDAIVGGTISMAAYFLPDDLVLDSDTIPVDDPNWLIAATAAKLAFNDLTYEDKYPDLNNEANSLYAQMASNNRRGTSGNPRTIQTKVTRIRGVRR